MSTPAGTRRGTRGAGAGGRLDRALPALLAVAAALIAGLVALAVIRPASVAPLSYDAYASTLHFDRILGGHRLEGALGTTPKPLLTVAFGLAHAVGGWQLVGLVSVLAWGASVGMATRLAVRVGGTTAGVAVAVLLIASPTLLLETAWGLGTVWAIGLWSAAALAASADRPRWSWCGALLGLATLVRVETVIVVAAIFAIALGSWAVTGRRPTGPLRAAILALWALPVMAVHDVVLTGDPLYSLKVSALYGNALASIGALPGPDVAIGLAVGPVSGAPVLAGLAILGVVALVRARAVPVLVGVLALGLGVGVALPLLAASGRLADARYVEPIRFALVFAAAMGIAWLLSLAAWAVRRRWPASDGDGGRSLRIALGAALAVAVALVAAPTFGPADPTTSAVIERFRMLATSADVARPTLDKLIAADPSVAGGPPLGNGAQSRQDQIQVPGNVRPRMALDLGLPLTQVSATDALHLDIADGNPPPGTIVVHSGGDLPPEVFVPFEVSATTSIGAVQLQPLLSDPASATWVIRIDAVGGGPQPVAMPR